MTDRGLAGSDAARREGLRHALCRMLAVVAFVFASWLGSGAAARAEPSAGDVAACLNIGAAAVSAAGEIAAAVADPTYAACISQAASGDVVTIGMMAAVTILWATDTDAFSNPKECNDYVKNTALKMIAGLLQEIITSNDTVRGLLKGLIGNDGLALIDSIASAAVNDLAQALLDKLWEALGPLTHQLECGCAAAGTVAIIKNAGEDVAKAADSCLDLLKDPVAAFNALLDDPAGVAKAVVTAACDAVKEEIDVCGYAKDFVTVVGAVCDIPGIDSACDAGAGILNGAWNGIKDAAHAAKCYFFGCDEPAAPPPPTVCGAGDWPNYGCVCKPPMGVTYQQVKQWSSLYNESYLTTTAVCDYCPSNMGLTIPGDTTCRACPVGMHSRNADGTPTADGSCVPYYCAENERYKADNSSCFSCPAGSQFKPDNSGCMPVCKDYLVNASGSGACTCPARADGQTPYDTGQSCEVSIASSCKPGERHDPATNTCAAQCSAANEVWTVVDKGIDNVLIYGCKACPDGQTAENNQCVQAPNNVCQTTVMCGGDQISTGDSCFSCPDGTVKDGNACVPACAPGSVAKQKPPLLKGALEAAGVGGNNGLLKQQLGGLAAPGPAGPVSACTLCGENQQTVMATSYGNGYSITESYCTSCPTGMISKPGDASCHWPLEFGVTSLPPKASGKLDPEQQIPWLKPANWRDFTERPAPPRQTGDIRTPAPGSLSGTPALPQAEPVCPPGYVMEAGICRIPQTGAPLLPRTPGLATAVGAAAVGAAIVIPQVARAPSTVLPVARRPGASGVSERPARRKPGLSGQEALPQQARPAAVQRPAPRTRAPAAAPPLTGSEALPQGQGAAPRPAGRAPSLTGTPALPQAQPGPMRAPSLRAPSLGGGAPQGANPGSRAPGLTGTPALPQAPSSRAPSLSAPAAAPALGSPAAPRAPVLPGAASPQRSPGAGRQGTDPNTKPF